MAARVYDEVFGYIEDATKTLPGAAAPGELRLLQQYTYVLYTEFRQTLQWRSDAVRGPGSAVRSGPQGPLQRHSPKGLWVRDSRVSCGPMWHAHKSSVAETKLILESFKGINVIIDIMNIAAHSIV